MSSVTTEGIIMETEKHEAWWQYECAIGFKLHIDFIVASAIANSAIQEALEYSRFRSKLPV
jgi:hypothetical protein